MTKNQFLNKAAIPIFIIGFILCSLAYIPILRYTLKLDSQMSLAFSSTLVLLIGGYMAGIGAMIFLTRKVAIKLDSVDGSDNNKSMNLPHWLGLCLYIPIPFINVVIIYFAWLRDHANTPKQVANEYKKSLNFQITIYIFALLSFFLAPIAIGFFMLAMALVLHFFSTLYIAFSKKLQGKKYPVTINILSVD